MLGEALGAIGCRSVIDLLAEYTKDPMPEVTSLYHILKNNSTCHKSESQRL